MSSATERLSDLVIVDGPPGSGKGFLSSLYVQGSSWTQHLSAGDRVRNIRAGRVSSSYASIVLECLEKRQYLPDETFGGIVLEGMGEAPGVINLTLVDGFPHASGDFEYVQQRLHESGRAILGAVCLDATLDISIERMAYRGMRSGEDVRRSAVFAATEDEREYYAGRYNMYVEARKKLHDLLAAHDIRLELVDANPDLLNERTRQIVLDQFTRRVAALRVDNQNEEQ